ncbi:MULTISPECIES: pyridoxal phosphate-dependent aminotransferase [Actinopolyspora]|uniref:Succinyldiaminopimelate aminotransferase apoenzyme n=1 Tax=Actinopolyspora saharensis TaxID=995062 RepID=A0A1H1GAK3_9ACTN|nr:pyridoxal phosphate-dependent aminotransferase [Actinopolyspora saharensis]NHD16457.1 pyridoxal phosphate-dependent aminotransferase [Actinopolyspora sp. BKK2]NHE75680.1 pyridoxal phosphate-dependent aminotransferase [Actinopolyspora sp. BKK1]SDR10119.1 succinyldiaminopimelate aminotransferase apoenzyme [Actinopolyspora saharensis]
MRTPALTRRLRPFTSTIFAEITELARSTGSVNLGQGFPDTDGPAGMLRRAENAIGEGVNQYPPGAGEPELRAAISAQRRADYGIEHDPEDEILVTVGATEAVNASMMALVEPDEEVVLIEPYYDAYPVAVAMAGGVHRSVPLRAERGRFRLDTEALRAAVGPRTRAVVLNSPHNPTGTVFTADELSAIAETCRENDLLAITDEVYEHLLFDGRAHTPLATLPGMAERTLSISSAGKSFSVTGWKIGWVCGPAELVSAVRAAKQFTTFVGGAPFQPAVAHALNEERSWLEGLRSELEQKRDRLTSGLTRAGFEVLPSEGTYFVCADVRPLGYSDGAEFCRALPERIGVAAIPPQVLCDDPEPMRHLARFAFCKRDEVIDEAVERLLKLGQV